MCYAAFRIYPGPYGNQYYLKNNYDEIKNIVTNGSNAVTWTGNCPEGYKLHY